MSTQTKAQAEQPDRQALQAAGTHPAPCARHCEAQAFEIAARGMRRQIAELQAALAEQPAQQEPVGIVKDLFTNAAWDKLDVVGSTKVYLHTTPQAQTAREPLTAKEIAEFVGTHEYGPEQLKWFRLGEAAHGITKGNT